MVFLRGEQRLHARTLLRGIETRRTVLEDYLRIGRHTRENGAVCACILYNSNALQSVGTLRSDNKHAQLPRMR